MCHRRNSIYAALAGRDVSNVSYVPGRCQGWIITALQAVIGATSARLVLDPGYRQGVPSGTLIQFPSAGIVIPGKVKPVTTLALDIGGANLKAAHSDDVYGCTPLVVSRRRHAMTNQLQSLARRLPPFERLVVTMTAELCDCFETKRQGVACVLDAVEAFANGRPVSVWLTQGRFAELAEARDLPLSCAAANWHALGTWLASVYPSGLSVLIDTGSTTTDIVKLADGRVLAAGLTDTSRLVSGELVYIGATRTPLEALTATVMLGDTNYPLMAECFATTADVYLLTGDLPEQPGRAMTKRHAAAHIVRMIGADLEMLTRADATALAHTFSKTIIQRIGRAINQVCADAAPVQRVILSGSGAFIGAAAASAVLGDVPQHDLAQRIGDDAATAACAYALVKLADAAGLHVIKLGGSLLNLPNLDRQLSNYFKAHAGEQLVLIVGGGAGADAVRQADRRDDLGDVAAHWMAIEAMRDNTLHIAETLSCCRIVKDRPECAAAWSAGKVAVIDPLAWLRREEAAGITIPHRWSFTSDSIAAHIATQLHAQQLTLLKSTLPDAVCCDGVVDDDFLNAAARVPRIDLINLRTAPPQRYVLR